jgi:hypothetical protein
MARSGNRWPEGATKPVVEPVGPGGRVVPLQRPLPDRQSKSTSSSSIFLNLERVSGKRKLWQRYRESNPGLKIEGLDT